MNENSYDQKNKIIRIIIIALIIFCLGCFFAFVIFESKKTSNEIVEEASNEATLTIVIRTSEAEIEVSEVELESGNEGQEVTNETSSWCFQVSDEIPFDFSQMEFGEEIPFDFSQTKVD
jgi:uncharacterized protein YpmS